MKEIDISALTGILGPTPWKKNLDLRPLELEWGLTLPSEVKAVSGTYGDTLIDDFLFIYGPSSMRDKGNWMSQYIQGGNSQEIVGPVLPIRGGMLYWGHTIDGDQLFLTPRDEGTRWTVSAFRRSWGDWHSTDLDLISWLESVFKGEIETDWLPEWPDRHTFERDC
ncbi:hypothetical protein SLA_5282 [Streptomyces laurentii]|uniref:Knr4/Smi1-like domain-containing protein n=1 Tax=Streptomyces laurentii TaxID=39478 RepID=A0A160P640_STRLU|nr:hypothetical protein SLA_5282 [Streptomyces laurentii]